MYSRLRISIATLFLLFIVMVSGLPAQAQFQRTYGGTGTEAGRGGVQQTFDGGFITVGESNSGTPDYDVYVVKTNATGNTSWSYKYDIGYEDYGKHIEQTSDSGYIITGYTQDTGNCCQWNNLFLLKINKFGTVQWTNTYGGTDDEQGWCVRQLRDSGYIVAGRSNSFGQGDYDGYLIRTDQWGNVIWSRVYGERDVDYFLSCIQDSVTTDVYAVGATSSYGNASEGFAVRVDLADGTLVWDYVYGGTKDEVFRSIRRIAGGNLIVAGFTKSYSFSASALLLQLNRQGSVTSSMVYKSNASNGWSEFSDAVEINSGTIGVVGLFNNVTNGFAGYDMLVGRVTIWNMLMNANRVYGGLATDQGFSIGRVGAAGPKVISAGLTNSFAGGQQLYLIETDFAIAPICNEEADIDTIYSDLDSIPIDLPTSRAIVRCTRTAHATYLDQASDSVCSIGVESGIRREMIRNSDSSDADPDRVSPVDRDPSVSPGEGAVIGSYPNPVRRGDAFVIEYEAVAGARATIEVVDIGGTIVHSMTREVKSGDNRISVGTAGWNAGNYIVRIIIDNRTDARRIVVSERLLRQEIAGENGTCPGARTMSAGAAVQENA